MSNSIQNQPPAQSSTGAAQSDAQGVPYKDKSSSIREMSRRVKDNCRALLENFNEIIRLSKVMLILSLESILLTFRKYISHFYNILL